MVDYDPVKRDYDHEGVYLVTFIGGPSDGQVGLITVLPEGHPDLTDIDATPLPHVGGAYHVYNEDGVLTSTWCEGCGGK